MAPPESAMADSSKPLQHILTKGISDIRSLVTCKICTRFMYEPFTTKCGHTFCYACLSKWLRHGQRKRQCPDCRTKIKEEPSPNYTIRDIVNLLTSNAAFIDDEDTLEELQAEQQQEAENVEKDKTGPNAAGLFRGLFRIPHRDLIQDVADGVMRCPNCSWEIEDSYCVHCDVDLRIEGYSWPDFSDEFEPEFDTLSQEGRIYEDYYESYESEFPDEEDEEFIDDGDIELGSEGGSITPTEDVELGISESELRIGRGYSSDVEGSSSMFVPDIDGTLIEDDIHNADVDTTTTEDEDSDVDSDSDGSEDETVDGNSVSDGNDDNDDNEDEDTESSAADSDDEPIIRQPGSQRRSEIPFRQAGVRQRNNSRRPDMSVIDLTTPPNRNSRLTRRQQPASTSTGGNSTTICPATTEPLQNSSLSQDPDADTESESDIPVPTRRRKRERIVLSDSEDEDVPVEVHRNSRSQRRRLNQQLPTPTEPSRARARQPFLAHPRSCRAN